MTHSGQGLLATFWHEVFSWGIFHIFVAYFTSISFRRDGLEKLQGSVKTGERHAHRLRVARAKNDAQRTRLVGKKYLERTLFVLDEQNRRPDLQCFVQLFSVFVAVSYCILLQYFLPRIYSITFFHATFLHATFLHATFFHATFFHATFFHAFFHGFCLFAMQKIQITVHFQSQTLE